MDEPQVAPDTPDASEAKERVAHSFRSLKELVDFVAGKAAPVSEEETGRLTELLPFPFLAIVGQREMKLALLLSLINPNIGGVLLVGPRGTAKTTAVRSLLDLLPQVDRSICIYGCLPEDVEVGGMDAICPDCAKKYAEGQPLTAPDRVRLIELPLNARLDDVVGGVDERAALNQRLRIRRGILAQADKNLLYIDEINLLANEIVDAILDAAALGSYTVRRGPVTATYRARFNLIGSMNPEEGRLRPQILDRFGLRIIVQGLDTSQDRLDAYRLVQAYRLNPRQVAAQFAVEMQAVQSEIKTARERLTRVVIPDHIATPAIQLVQKMGIDSLRAEITWFESARAHAAADNRTEVNTEDLKAVAPMALRLRRSQFMTDYFKSQNAEEIEMSEAIKRWAKPPRKKH